MVDVVVKATDKKGIDTEIDPGSMTLPAAYLVLPDSTGTIFYARNGKSGRLDQNNADPATLFNAVISGS
jgi:hypothetical protein